MNFMPKRQPVVFVFVIAVVCVLSAMALIFTKHESRKLFVELEGLTHLRDEHEYDRLSFWHEVHPSRSATRRCALLARKFSAISSALAEIALPMGRNFGRIASGIDGMPRYCSGSRDASRMKRLTIRSSSE